MSTGAIVPKPRQTEAALLCFLFGPLIGSPPAGRLAGGACFCHHTGEFTMKVQCPTCKRADLDTTMAFFVPAHASAADSKPCEGGDKGSKPSHSKDGKKQLCFKCGRYVSTYARFCPHCNK